MGNKFQTNKKIRLKIWFGIGEITCLLSEIIFQTYLNIYYIGIIGAMFILFSYLTDFIDLKLN